jgi:hypothetical protein
MGSMSDFGAYTGRNSHTTDDTADYSDHGEVHENSSVDLPAHDETPSRKSTAVTEMKSIQLLRDSKTPIISILVGRDGHLFVIFNDGALAVNSFTNTDKTFNFEADKSILVGRD